MRPRKMIEGVGGKGFASSVVLQTLGAENIALGFVAGLTGQQLVKVLDRYKVSHDLVWVEGETRIAHVVVETNHHRHSHLIAAGLSVSPEAYQSLIERYQGHLSQAHWVIAGGTLPTGVPVSAYRQLITLAHKAGVPVLLDSSGPPALEAVPVRPAVLKMNEDEFIHSFGVRPESIDELIVEARVVREREQLPALVVTCGVNGVIGVTPQEAYWAITPPQQAVNAAGAGDGASAALAWRLSQGDSWPEALRWTAATGAAVVLTEGTADCHLADIERLREQTQVYS